MTDATNPLPLRVRDAIRALAEAEWVEGPWMRGQAFRMSPRGQIYTVLSALSSGVRATSLYGKPRTYAPGKQKAWRLVLEDSLTTQSLLVYARQAYGDPGICIWTTGAARYSVYRSDGDLVMEGEFTSMVEAATVALEGAAERLWRAGDHVTYPFLGHPPEVLTKTRAHDLNVQRSPWKIQRRPKSPPLMYRLPKPTNTGDEE